MTRKERRAARVRKMEGGFPDVDVVRLLADLKPAARVRLLEAAGWSDERIAAAVAPTYSDSWIHRAMRGWSAERREGFRGVVREYARRRIQSLGAVG